ncbi:hypothetical protein ACHRVW_03970 [Flavobacterium collinsii]|jgi:hypothetical protein|uniref:Uncharacterized protein n=1 Tax=Flavobacterium collinsii TaxID=1114861 RepID=A0A9W4TGF1_9FLAO|nr:hypothetical protein [Flavobacterium collinsii]GIQ59330.1 hypothetical protein Flavo103_24660 [Flavobacterium collinsii]CAA9199175.1 hypothetical protein FLACOL7796_02584 [Flavobacterium collinsii]CAI2766476.1 conserved protein of unknown function [Flavobacterium collinsii]
MKTLHIILREILYRLKTDFKRFAGIVKNKRENAVKIKGELYSSESNSLLFQMYLHEEEDLFI